MVLDMVIQDMKVCPYSNVDLRHFIIIINRSFIVFIKDIIGG